MLKTSQSVFKNHSVPAAAALDADADIPDDQSTSSLTNSIEEINLN
jgi:hypothetical protein